MVDRNPHSPVELRIELGRAHVRPAAASQLARGSVVTLESLVNEPVDIVAGGRRIAQGEVLELDGSFCVRVTKILAPNQVGR